MPYKSEKSIKLAGTDKDKRRKLTDKQKDEIVSLRGTITQLQCAKQFGVSRRTIQFLWNPDAHAENIKRRQERGGSKIYYEKQKNNEYMKSYRHHKQDIYLSSTKTSD